MEAKLKLIFNITGAKLYMDWFLITNPVSKNPIIKFLWGWTKFAYTATDYKSRFRLSISLFTVHFLMFFGDIYFGVNNIFNNVVMWEIVYNIYPMIIQVYIGYRCWSVIKWKKYIKYVNNREQSVKLSLS